MISSNEKGSAQVPVAPATEARVGLTPGSNSSTDPAGIRAEMAQTRAEMSVTLEALQERLDPQRLKDEATTKVRDTANRWKDQATEKVREATIGRIDGKVGDIVMRVEDTASDTRSGIADAIRKNPIPAGLIGMGLAWIFFSGSERNSRGTRPDGRYSSSTRSPGRPVYGGISAAPGRSAAFGGGSVQDRAQHLVGQAGARVQQAGQQVQQIGNQAQDQVENLTEQVKGTVEQLGDKAQDQVGNVADHVKGSVQQIGSQAQDQVDQVKGTVQQFGSQARDQVDEFRGDAQDQVQSFTTDVQLQTQRLSGSFNRIFRENPLALGVVALALGATAAMMAPKTPQEDQLFGEAREQVLHKAQVAAHEALDQVQKVADQAQQTVSAPPRS